MMKTKLRVKSHSFMPLRADFEKNTEYMLATIQDSVDCDLIIFPELSTVGYQFRYAPDLLQVKGFLLRIKEVISDLDVAVVFGTSVLVEGTRRNRLYFISKDQEKSYDKINLFRLIGEDKFFVPGDSVERVLYKGWSILMQICYDLRFPETVRAEVLDQEVDTIVYIAAWPKVRQSHWDLLLRARAVENQCYVIGVNQLGIDEKGVDYGDGSNVIFNPLGDKEVGEIDFSVLAHVRANFNTIR